MSWLNLLTICLSTIIGVASVAVIFVSGWVKYSHITELKTHTNQEIAALTSYTKEQFKAHREELNKLWEKIAVIDVLASKLEDVKVGIERLERMLINGIEKRTDKRDI